MIAPKRVAFRSPRPCQILIWDETGADALFSAVLSGLVKKSICHVMCTRGEELNLFVLFLSIMRHGFKALISSKRLLYYSLEYIRLCEPKLVITFIDNAPTFWQLAAAGGGEFQTAFIQNGRRFEVGDIFENQLVNHDQSVTHMFVFNKAMAAKYSSIIAGNTYAVGSMKSNRLVPPRNESAKLKALVFISGYEETPDESLPVRTLPDGKALAHLDYFSLDRWLVKECLRWCILNGYSLIIAGRSTERAGKEADWFQAVLGKSEGVWEFLPRKDIWSSYRLVDSAELVVNSDSTLGYESLARGNKTVFFASRDRELHTESSRFGWPAHTIPEGVFWTSSRASRDFDGLLDRVISMDPENWSTVVENHAHEVMATDPHNQVIRSIIQEALGDF
jgi:surface carbohydrate biosynthesis protein